ncbi:M13 family metallopeptidase [Gordonia sp. ABSL1-1]|uniref:M13 family metallopeptidase n=1 Tax=Gordonia sp. ABSL1-1 TaxID=3053923 RepID=UPI002573FC9B|nr:M13 family metallopeptidase [Gordonia sp. ABSL1-1]MDL9936671.1 M13 family metallopeptidase [Gordonia sp. ABSL1-1]
MSSSDGPVQVNRRSFLLALGAVPLAVALTSCDTAETQPKLLAGPDLSGVDAAVRPQDDLYRHINGTWLRDYRLPRDKTYYGTFSEVSDRVQEQLRAVIDGIRTPAPGSEGQQIRDLYDARVDEATLDKLGIEPLQPMFDRIDAATTKAELAKVMAGLPIGGIIGLGVGVDRHDSNAHVPVIGQSGLGMGDPQYYLEPEFASYLSAYETFLRKLAAGASLADPNGAADRTLRLEKRLAPAFWDNVTSRDSDATYNPMTWAQLKALAPTFDWEPWLAGSTDRPRELFADVVVGEPSYITAAGKVWTTTDMRTLRDWLKLSVLGEYARYLHKPLRDTNFAFVQATSGLQQRPEVWKSAVGLVDNQLGEQLGKLYVAQYFPPEAKEQVKQMVDNLLSAYRVNFERSSWMSAPTRSAAVAKLDKITANIGYPDHWVDYSDLKITRGRLVESLLAINDFEVKRAFGRLGRPVDKTEWGMSPQTVNAYYDRTSNSINFPAAFMQPPFFDVNATAAVNYGAIGAVIGHEIGHGFDDQGSKFDGDGNRTDWWTKDDQAAFEEKTQQLVDQYNVLIPQGLPASSHVDGQLTVGENLADLRGLLIALAAYRTAEAHAGRREPDYTPVFQSWARNWREKQTPQTLEQQIAGDSHSPGEFRANQVVRNVPEYYLAFGVRPSDKMFLAEDQRVSL